MIMEENTNQYLIGKRIKASREEANLTQEELGKKIGYSAMGISYFEKGLRKIKTDDLEKISKVLNKPVSYFLQSMMGYSVDQSTGAEVVYRRGDEDISEDQKNAEKEALKDFDDFIKTLK